MQRQPAIWREWWPCLVLVGATGLFFTPAWWGRAVLYAGLDIRTIHYPIHAAYAGALRQGQLLLWTPLLAAGFPLYAEGQMGGLYPPNLLLYRLLPLDLAHNWVPLLHVLLAQVTAYAFARQLRLSRTAAALCGFTFSWSVPVSVLGDFVPAYAMAWMPAVLATLAWGYRTHRPAAFLLAGVVWGLQGLAFFPQGLALTGVAAGIFVLVSLIRAPGRARLGLAASTVVAALWGAALSAVQWLPTLELTAFSIRAGGLDPAFAGQGSLPPWAVGTFWAPHFLAVLGQAGYVGILGLVLAAAALPRWRWDWRVGFGLLLAALSLLLAFGRYSPLFPLTRQLPGLSYFRNTVRFTFLTRFGLALLAGLGWDRLRAPGWSPASLRRWSIGVLGWAGLMTGASWAGGWLLGRLKPTLTVLGERYAAGRLAGSEFHVQSAEYFRARVEQMLGAFRASLSVGNGELWAALGLACLAAGWLWWRARRPGRAWIAVGVWLVVGDLMGHAGDLAFRPPEVVHQVPRAVAFLQEALAAPDDGRIYTLVDQPVVPGQEAPYPLPENVNLRYGIPSVGIYSSLGTRRSYELLGDLGAVNLAFGVAPTDEDTLYARLPLLNLLGVRYVLAVHPLEGAEHSPLRLVYQDAETWVYENLAALPRAFVVAEAETGLSPEEIRQRMRSPDFDPQAAALLEARPAEAVGGFVGPAAHLAVAEAHRLVAETEGGGWLVLTDAFYPGWRAWVDGEPAPIYRADYLLRAVPLGPGPHRVTFRYEPQSFRWGAWGSGAAWCATLLAGALLWLRR